MNDIKIIKLCLILIINLTTLVTWADSDQIQIYKQNDQFRANIPTKGGVSPDVIYSGTSNRMFFATGQAAINISSQQAVESSQPSPVLNLSLNEMIYLLDNSNRAIGAFYPLNSRHKIYVTALHVLKDSKIQQIPGQTQHRLFGFRNILTGEIYDVAFLAENDEAVRLFVSNSFQLKINSLHIVINHLNVIDGQGEVGLTESHAQVITESPDYLFFQNSSTSFVGPGSSGAIVRRQSDGLPVGSLVCLSNLLNKENVSVIRALKFANLAEAELFELSSQVIEKFQPLQCKKYDGRRGGGD